MLSFALVRGFEYNEKVENTCAIPTGARDKGKCDWGKNKGVEIGGCEDNQCLTITGHVSACESKGQIIVSASLSVDVEIDTWLGRKTVKQTIPSFNLMVGAAAKTLYVHDLLEGTVWIKAQPNLSTGRVSLWGNYALNQDGFCAYIITDKLAVGATAEDSAFVESDSANNDSFPAWGIILITSGALLCLGIAFCSGRLSIGEEKTQMVDLGNTGVSRQSITVNSDNQSIDRESILLDDQEQTTDVGSIHGEDAGANQI